jgi:hypothetical protein
MKRRLLLISFATATILAALQHEALAQQPTPPTGPAAAPAPDKAKKAPPPKSGKKAPAKAAESRTPPPASPPASMPPPPVVELMPMDLPPPASNAPPAPVSPGAGSIASGITPVRYGAPTPGSSRLIASVPVLPPKAAPTVEAPAGAPVPPAPAQMAPAVAKVTPYTPPVFSPPVPGRKPAQGQTQTVETPVPASPATAPAGGTQSAAKPGNTAPGYTAIVPITPFGAAPPQPPAPASQPVPDPITFTVRLPTIVMLEPKP